ncbi:hypothetical protein AAHI06_08880 [Pseudomonas salmasensis]|uniref:hypothetical protein n=1 Tax=Pseudomonas salmasensis TaxID=2745514 RepID=UPI0032195C6A
MVAISAVMVTATAKLLSPLVADIYGGAKGKVKDSLKKLTILTGAKKIARGLLKIEKIKTIWSPDKELFISDFYYSSSLEVAGEKVKVAKIGDLPAGNLIVQGIVGQGKSIFMRFLASTAMRSENFNNIPIFLELRNISAKKILSTLFVGI